MDREYSFKDQNRVVIETAFFPEKKAVTNF